MELWCVARRGAREGRSPTRFRRQIGAPSDNFSVLPTGALIPAQPPALPIKA